MLGKNPSKELASPSSSHGVGSEAALGKRKWTTYYASSTVPISHSSVTRDQPPPCPRQKGLRKVT